MLPPTLIAPVSDPAMVLTQETFEALRKFIHERTGIYFQDKKKYLLEGRIARRLQALQLGGFEDYLQLLRYGRTREEEFEYLCDAVTINETFFFRNEAQFDALEQTLVPELVQLRQNGIGAKLRVWSAACSSGEEPYTIAMIFKERLKPRFPGLSIEIEATDISPAMLRTAEKGIYSEYSMRNVPPEYTEKYFTVSGGRFHLREDIREMVKFRNINLFDKAAMRVMRNFDLILCRNVLIYFDTDVRIQVVSDLYDGLRPGGYLLIGYSEVLHGISSAFRIRSLPKTSAYKKD